MKLMSMNNDELKSNFIKCLSNIVADTGHKISWMTAESRDVSLATNKAKFNQVSRNQPWHVIACLVYEAWRSTSGGIIQA